jgi:hypothetical protein
LAYHLTWYKASSSSIASISTKKIGWRLLHDEIFSAAVFHHYPIQISNELTVTFYP